MLVFGRLRLFYLNFEYIIVYFGVIFVVGVKIIFDDDVFFGYFLFLSLRGI